jgi:hypothetical protein
MLSVLCQRARCRFQEQSVVILGARAGLWQEEMLIGFLITLLITSQDNVARPERIKRCISFRSRPMN